MTRAPCRRRTGGALPRAENFVDLITAEVLNEGWIQSYPCKTKTSHETEGSLSKFLEPSHKPKVVRTDNSMEFGKACEVLSWNHRTSTPHQSETNGLAERAVRRVKEGTSTALLQSGLDERWWSDSMECYCFMRNVQDLLADGKTPCERRFGERFKGHIIFFGAMVEYHPISPRDQARIHQIGKKVLPEIFLVYESVAVSIWKGDILKAELEDLDKFDASDNNLRRINAKEVLIRQEDDEFIFPFADGTAKLSGRDYEFRDTIPRREPTVRSEAFSRELQGESGERQNPQMTLKPVPTSGRFKVTSSVVITMNLEFNSTCRRKKHSVFHRNTLMLQGLHIQIWMCCKRNGLTIAGMLIHANICQILGKDSRSSLY